MSDDNDNLTSNLETRLGNLLEEYGGEALLKTLGKVLGEVSGSGVVPTVGKIITNLADLEW